LLHARVHITTIHHLSITSVPIIAVQAFHEYLSLLLDRLVMELLHIVLDAGLVFVLLVFNILKDLGRMSFRVSCTANRKALDIRDFHVHIVVEFIGLTVGLVVCLHVSFLREPLVATFVRTLMRLLTRMSS